MDGLTPLQGFREHRHHQRHSKRQRAVPASLRSFQACATLYRPAGSPESPVPHRTSPVSCPARSDCILVPQAESPNCLKQAAGFSSAPPRLRSWRSRSPSGFRAAAVPDLVVVYPALGLSLPVADAWWASPPGRTGVSVCLPMALVRAPCPMRRLLKVPSSSCIA